MYRCELSPAFSIATVFHAGSACAASHFAISFVQSAFASFNFASISAIFERMRLTSINSFAV